MRIGILGGTFNPVHLGHLILAETARQALRLDRVLLVPCYRPPHKDGRELAAAAHRLAMVRLAVRGNLRLSASSIEVERGGRSYTVETLRALHRRYRGRASFVFLTGSDVMPALHQWRRVDEILRLCRFAVATRAGHAVHRRPAGVRSFPMPAVEISARDIRRRIAHGHSIRYLIPDAVAAYIRRHRLYRRSG